jgi:hypothetical protein
MPAVTVYRPEGDPLTTNEPAQLHQALLIAVDTAEHQARRHGLDEPMWPLIELHTADGIVLGVALRRDRGALYWMGQHGENDVTSGGSNPEPAIYYLGGHDTPVPPHSEIPLEKILNAASEFLTTGYRPTTVHWQDSITAWHPFTTSHNVPSGTRRPYAVSRRSSAQRAHSWRV